MTKNKTHLAQMAAIYKFRDYQKEWLTSHNDIELYPDTEELVLDFLNDTARAFIGEEMDIDDKS